MTNPETVENTPPKVVEKESGSPAIENDSANKSVFLERVSDIPVVNVAKEYGTAAYNQVKQFNKLTRYTLSKAESTALYLAVTAKPFLEKIQPQAMLVDHLACRGLDAVEDKAPFILKTPEEMVEEARKLVASSLETGYQKVDEIKTISTGAISTVKSYGLQKANEALTSTDNLVDKYLPPAFADAAEGANVAESQSITERAAHLTTKVSQRVYGHGIKHFFAMHRMSQDSITQLAYTVELLQHFRTNAQPGKTMQEYFDEAKLKATWIWEELNKEPADAEEAEKSLEQRMLSLARRMTSGLVHLYESGTVPLAGVPQVCLDGVNAARSYAAELFTQFDQALKTGEATTPLLQRARDKIAALDRVVKTIVDSVRPEIQMEEIELEALPGSSHQDGDNTGQAVEPKSSKATE